MKTAILVLGCGNIGGYWLDHFAAQLRHQQPAVDARVVAIFNSTKQLLRLQGVDLGDWRQQFQQHAQARQATAVESCLRQLRRQGRYQHFILLDLTASAIVAADYWHWFNAGADIVSANKQAGAAELGYYQRLQQGVQQQGRRWLSNTSVGAALPVQQSILALRQCGDPIRQISGVFSGTLSWLFHHYDGRQRFSDLLRQAQQQGMTEPDPRDDLSGQDVARKLLILARTAGWPLQHSDIKVSSLVPKVLEKSSIDDFWRQRQYLDQSISEAYQQCQAQQRLAVIADVHPDQHGRLQASVGLQRIDADHPAANLAAADNAFVIYSDCYQQPLSIRGPGAGRAVTAAGVQQDVLSLLHPAMPASVATDIDQRSGTASQSQPIFCG